MKPEKSPMFQFCVFMFKHEPVNKTREVVIETMGKCRGYMEGRGLFLTRIKDVLDRFLIDYDAASDGQLTKACGQFYSFLHGYFTGKEWPLPVSITRRREEHKRYPTPLDQGGMAALEDLSK